MTKRLETALVAGVLLAGGIACWAEENKPATQPEAAQPAAQQPEAAPAETTEEHDLIDLFAARTELTFYSAYIWRGQIICNLPVWQPAQDLYMDLGEDAEWGRAKVRLWGSLYLSDRKYPRQYGGLHILDVTASYMKTFFDSLDFEAGHIWYTMPQKAKQGVRSTDEFLVGAQWRNPYLTPRAYLWWDYSDKGRNEKDMLFLDLQVAHDFPLVDKLTLGLASGFGVGNGPYMRTYSKGVVTSPDFNYFHSDAMLNYAVTDWFKVGTSLTWFYNLSHEVRHSPYDLRDDYHQFLRIGIHLVATF